MKTDKEKALKEAWKAWKNALKALRAVEEAVDVARLMVDKARGKK